MIELLVTRLKNLPELRLVSGTADFEAASAARPPALPAAYVLPLEDVAGNNTLACGGVAQMITSAYGIAIAVSNAADAKGAAALSDLKPVRKAITSALLGWTPGDDFAPLEYGGGVCLGFYNGVLWWQDVYITQFLIKT